MQLDITINGKTTQCEVFDIDGLIFDFRVPYFVPSEVIRAIEEGLCKEQLEGTTDHVGSGGTVFGTYHWKIKKGG